MAWTEQGWHSTNGSVAAVFERWVVVHLHVADFGMIFLDDGNSGEKSLQRDAIVGRWDGHTLNLGGVGRMAAEHHCVVSSGSRGRDRGRQRQK